MTLDRKARELVSRGLDETLSEYERNQLEQALQDPACAKYHDDLLRGRELLQQGLVEPPDNFEWKVQLGIQRALRGEAQGRAMPAPPRRFWLPVGATAAAMAVAVVVMGVWLLPGGNGLQPDGAPMAGVSLDQAERLRDTDFPKFGVPPGLDGRQVGGVPDSRGWIPAPGVPDSQGDLELLVNRYNRVVGERDALRLENQALRDQLQQANIPSTGQGEESPR